MQFLKICALADIPVFKVLSDEETQKITGGGTNKYGCKKKYTVFPIVPGSSPSDINKDGITCLDSKTGILHDNKV